MDTETMNTILAAVAGGVVIPIVGQLKNTFIVTYIKAEFLTIFILTGVAWGLTSWLMPGMTPSAIIQLALASSGSATLIYAGKKMLPKKEKA